MPSVRRECLYCGKEFFVYPSALKKGGGKYCSQRCRATDKNNMRWSDPDKHETQSKKLIEYSHNNKDKLSEIQKRAFSDPTRRSTHAEMVKKSWSDPTIKKRRSDAIKAALSNPKTKALRSHNTHKRVSRPEERKLQSERSKQMWSDPIFRDQMTGKNAFLWQGGKSFEPYCEKFSRQLKRYVRLKFGNCCVICGSSDSWRSLDVHHIDYNKLQGCKGKTWALVPLCHSCHAKTNFHKWYWFNLLINYWAKNDEINLHDVYNFIGPSSTT